MEANRQVATMLANTGVVFFAGATVAYFLNPGKVPLIIAMYGLSVWISFLFLVIAISDKGSRK